jgi:hypothetical protein
VSTFTTKSVIAVLAAVLFGALVLVGVQPRGWVLQAADHREAPFINELPAADIGDVFVFVNPNDPTKVVFVLGVNGFAIPSVNASYSFDPDVLYQFKIDNTGDAREDLVIQARFSGTEAVRSPQCTTARGGQFVTVRGPAAPSTVGTTNVELPSSPSDITGCSNTVISAPNGIRVFAGLREDPFVVDVGQFNRILANTQDQFREVTSPALGPLRGRQVRGDGTSGVDGFRGTNGSFLVVEVPRSMIEGTANRAGTYLQNNTTIGMWGTTSLPAATAGQFTQVERMGQTLLFTVFVPIGLRDALNAAAPENDVTAMGSLIPDALTTTDNDGTGNTIAGRASLLQTIGVTSLPNGAPLALPSTFANTDRDLLRKALLPDILRLDLARAPNDLAVGANGLQNGRRLGDDVVDILLLLARQLADVRFPAGSGLPGSGPTGTRNALDCTVLPACPRRLVLAVLQGTDFIKPDSAITNLATSGNEKPILADFPFAASPHPFPGDPGTTEVDVQPLNLMAAVLPGSRSVTIGSTATAFVSILNPSATTARGVTISLATPLPGTFTFQTADPATNAVTGTPNAPVNIPPGGSQSFVISYTPTAAVSPVHAEFNFAGTNVLPATTIPGVNTFLLSSAASATADVVALASTSGNTGVVALSGSPPSGAFAVAVSNVGATSSVTASVDTGATTLPVSLSICQTNPSTGTCTSAAASSVTSTVAGGATATYAVFVAANGPIAFDPAANRIFVRFRDAGNVTRGATSVAVRNP